MLPAIEPVEIGDAVNAKEHGLAINDELLGSGAMRGLDDQRVAARPIIAIAGEQPDALAIALYD